MQVLGQVLSACLQIFQIEFTVDGLTFTLWNILLWLIVAGRRDLSSVQVG